MFFAAFMVFVASALFSFPAFAGVNQDDKPSALSLRIEKISGGRSLENARQAELKMIFGEQFKEIMKLDELGRAKLVEHLTDLISREIELFHQKQLGVAGPPYRQQVPDGLLDEQQQREVAEFVSLLHFMMSDEFVRTRLLSFNTDAILGRYMYSSEPLWAQVVHAGLIGIPEERMKGRVTSVKMGIGIISSGMLTGGTFGSLTGSLLNTITSAVVGGVLSGAVSVSVINDRQHLENQDHKWSRYAHLLDQFARSLHRKLEARGLPTFAESSPEFLIATLRQTSVLLKEDCRFLLGSGTTVGSDRALPAPAQGDEP